MIWLPAQGLMCCMVYLPSRQLCKFVQSWSNPTRAYPGKKALVGRKEDGTIRAAIFT